jgi:uncharacterized membrane protein
VAPPAFAQGAWVPTRFFWWWQASRVVSDYTPWGAQQEVIDEFPSFSFILGDMHPHVLALPFVLLALALALNLYLRISASASQRAENGKWQIPNGESRTSNLRSAICDLRFAICDWRWEDFLVYALCLGGLGFLNTWDFPIYLSVVVAAYAIALLSNTQHATRGILVRSAFLFAALFLPGIFLYLPFWLGFQSQAAGFLPNLFNGTRLPQFLVMFGALLFIAVAFVVAQARQNGVRAWEAARWTLVVALGVLVVLASVLAVVVLLTWTGAISPQGPAAYLAAWLHGAPLPGLENSGDMRALISHSLLLRLLNPWTALGLTALLVAAILVPARRNTRLCAPPLRYRRSSHPQRRVHLLA